ncbi:probable flavin-containing monooxygenase 1 [Diospyros lotus]|uniref:probable flavin-containing monooxygenase 1 n=1 Tax=Diospyros lotus TaxID=55363 RepID=UPI0022513039|nr:probable flavin-containing monooxygenase 1 [Diospyros lotus]XP_052181066.1 probable flavin-containing monooxygenase 1 [Diospyros lotus]
MEKRVAIIGAGMSGILACKYTLEKGFHPIVFEAQESIGGVWTQTIESTKLQNTKEEFQFSDFPWSLSVKEKYPSNIQFLSYIESYAQHFRILPYIKFNTKVTSIDYVGESDEEMQSWDLWGGTGKPFSSKGKWHIKAQTNKTCSPEEYQVEFVILCMGRFSGLPNMPEFAPDHGPEVYTGKVMHSMDYSAMDNAEAAKLIKGKRIAVIGSLKSAVDIAAECANANGVNPPCTMIQRTPHWMFTTRSVWGVNLGYLYFNHFAELLVHKPGEAFLHSILAALLSTLRWGMSKFVESYLRWKLPLKKHGMIPNHSFLQEISSCQIAILPENFYDKVEEGSIILKKSQSFSFCEEGLVINGEDEPLKADLVIFATGYKGNEKLRNIFSSPTYQKHIMRSPTSIVPLYRQIIPPRIPQLAVIGYPVTFSGLHTSEMGCQWLAHFLDGAFELPSIKAMENEATMWENYMKKYAGRFYRVACIGCIHTWYNDQLCRDIGCKPVRKKGFFAKLFQPYGPTEFAGLGPRWSSESKH